MNSNALRVTLSSALGGLVGGLCGLQVSSWLDVGLIASLFSLLVGAAVGGFVAYCALDYRGVFAGIKHAFRKTVEWRPNVEFWKTWVCCLLFMTILVSWVVIFVGSATNIKAAANDRFQAMTVTGAITFFITLVCVGGLPLSTLMTYSKGDFLYGDEQDRQTRRMCFGVAKYGSPITAPFWLLYFIAKGLVWLTPRLPKVGVAVATWLCEVVAAIAIFCCVTLPVGLWHFTQALFLFIHSEERTLCFVAASIGAIVGFVCGNALIGAVAGGAVGFVEYHVVSVRLLKLVPVRSRA